MLNIYTDESKVPSNMEIVKGNDVFFNWSNAQLLNDELTRKTINIIDGSIYYNEELFESRFGGHISSEFLSTGAKTILNIKNNPDKCFYLRECGYNAEEFVYQYLDGNVLCNSVMLGHLNPNREYSVNGIKVVSEEHLRRVLDEACSG